MDRIDIQLLVPCLSALELSRLKALEQRPAESSAVVAARVASAREIQQRRLKGTGIFTNAEMDNKLIERFCPLSDECSQLLISIMEKLGLSMRAYFRIIKVARTIADLALCRDIRPEHISEAAAYRFLDRQNGPGW